MDSIVPGAIDTALSVSDAKREEGATYLRQGRFLEAANALGEATEIDPSDEGAWRLLGGAFASQGDYTRAAAAFQQSIALAPDNARNNYNLGLALEALDRTSEARSAFEQALGIDPTYEAARTRLKALGAPVIESFEPAPPPEPMFPIPPQMPNMLGAAPPEPPAMPKPSPSAALDRPTYEAPLPGQLSSIGFAAEPAISAFPPAPGEYVPQPVLGQGYDISSNNSGLGTGAPPEVAGGWNWAAFYLNWIWLINHKRVGFGIGMIFAHLIPVVYLGLAIYLGIKGNEIGWSYRRFDAISDYKACQSIWAKWTLGVFIVNIICAILWFVIVFAAAASSAGKGQ